MPAIVYGAGHGGEMETETSTGIADAGRTSGARRKSMIDTAKVRTRSELERAMRTGSEMEDAEKLLDYNSAGEESEKPPEAMSNENMEKETVDGKVFDSTEEDVEEEDSERSSCKSVENLTSTAYTKATASSGQVKNRLGPDYRTFKIARKSA